MRVALLEARGCLSKMRIESKVDEGSKDFFPYFSSLRQAVEFVVATQIHRADVVFWIALALKTTASFEKDFGGRDKCHTMFS